MAIGSRCFSSPGASWCCRMTAGTHTATESAGPSWSLCRGGASFAAIPTTGGCRSRSANSWTPDGCSMVRGVKRCIPHLSVEEERALFSGDTDAWEVAGPAAAGAPQTASQASPSTTASACLEAKSLDGLGNFTGGLDLGVFVGDWKDAAGRVVEVSRPTKPSITGLDVMMSTPQKSRRLIKLNVAELSSGGFACGHYELAVTNSSADRLVWEDFRSPGNFAIWERDLNSSRAASDFQLAGY